MKIGFIGAGNIAGAIISGAVKKKYVERKDIFIYDVSEEVRLKYKKSGLNILESFKDILSCEIIFLTVKPHLYEDILLKMKDVKNKIIVTVAPGIEISKVKKYLHDSNKVIRTMPNTPLMVGEGMTVITRDDKISDEEFDFVKGLFKKAGKVSEINESLMDATVALTSSSPALVYMFIEALADGGVFNGIDKESAIKMAAQAVLGSAKMVLETNEHPSKLKDMVCSPNGTTIRAVKSLEEDGFTGIIMNAMQECYKRSKELGK